MAWNAGSTRFPFPLLELPDELITSVLSFLNISDLCKATTLNKKMYTLCSGPSTISTRAALVSSQETNYQNILWASVLAAEIGVDSNNLLTRLRRMKMNKREIDLKEYYMERCKRVKTSSVTWRPVTELNTQLPPRRFRNTACMVKNKVYIIGGENPLDHTHRYNDIWSYNIDTKVWDKIIVPNVPRVGRHASSVIGTKIYTFGGYDGVSQYHHLNIFDTEALTWRSIEASGDKPTSHSNLTSAAVDDKFFIFGGTTLGSVVDSFYMLDTSTMTWTRLSNNPNVKGDYPGPRTGASLISLNGKLYLFGGGLWDHINNVWSARYNDIREYDVDNMEWKLLKTDGVSPQCSSCPTIFTAGVCIYFYGGALKTDTVVCNHLYCFDTITLTWSEVVPENPERINLGGRDCANFVVSGNTAFLYGGNFSATFGNEQEFCSLSINYPVYNNA